MNVQLYNSLIDAKNFLITVDNNEEKLKRIEGEISISGAMFKPCFPFPKHKKFEWKMFWWLFFVGFYISGFIYMWYIHWYNNKEDKKYESKVKKWKNSAEGKIAMQKTEEYRKELNKKYEIKKAEYGKYFAINYPKYSYLVGELKTRESVKREIKYINGLMGHVKNGAPTLEIAQQRYGEDLRFISEMEEKREEREREEARRKEQMNALEAIAKNQERTNDELRRLREKYVDRY